MYMIGKIRRIQIHNQLSDGEIYRRAGLARNTVKKWLKAPGDTQAKCSRMKPKGNP